MVRVFATIAAFEATKPVNLAPVGLVSTGILGTSIAVLISQSEAPEFVIVTLA